MRASGSEKHFRKFASLSISRSKSSMVLSRFCKLNGIDPSEHYGGVGQEIRARKLIDR
jgi:hypothetical protein